METTNYKGVPKYIRLRKVVGKAKERDARVRRIRSNIRYGKEV